MLILDTLFWFFDFIETFWLSMIHLFLILLLLLDQPMCPNDMLILGYWSSSPWTEFKETLDYFPIQVIFYVYILGMYLFPHYLCPRDLNPPLFPSIHVSILLSWFPSIRNAPTSPCTVLRYCALPFPCRLSGSNWCWWFPLRWWQWNFTESLSMMGSIQWLSVRPWICPPGRPWAWGISPKLCRWVFNYH